MAKKVKDTPVVNNGFSEQENGELSSFFEKNPNEQVCLKVDRCIFNVDQRGAADSYAKTHGFKLIEVDRSNVNLEATDGEED